MDWGSWYAYHDNILNTAIMSAAINVVLLLFLDSTHSGHDQTVHEIVQATVHHLNPDQVPIVAADQPLCTLAKQIQLTWLSTHGENHFVVMFGSLHIEMATLKVIFVDTAGKIKVAFYSHVVGD